jgi:hypothetical protein
MDGKGMALVVAALVAAGGCTSVKVSGTSRSGTEQLLLTGTWDRLLCRVDFRPLAGRRVFVEPGSVTVADKEWVLSGIRRRLAEQGALLVDKADKADVVVEAAFGAYGTDERSCSVGLPQVGFLSPLVGAAGASSSGSTSSTMTLSQTNRQDAVVKAALFAFEAKTGQLVWESGPLIGAQGVRDRIVTGSGPSRVSTLPEVEQYPAAARPRGLPF